MDIADNGSLGGKRALGLSVLLHMCAAPLFAVIFSGAVDPLPEHISVTSGAFRLTIDHRSAPRPQTRPVPNREAPAPQAAVAPLAPDRPATQRVATSARHPLGTPTHTPPRIAISVPSEPPTPRPTPTRAAKRSANGTSESASQAEPSAAPERESATPDPVATSEALARSLEPAPNGGWGQNFRDPTVLDDTALAELRARYHGALIHVDVDEDGHATRVTVEGLRLDADARAEIERKLSAIRYVPAECNGLRCAASLDIKV
jgi:hypothetical protein